MEFEELDEAQRKARDRAQRLREREISDVKKMLAFPEGRRTLWNLLSECGIFHSSFAESHCTMAYLEGRRSIGLKLLVDIQAARPEALQQMQREYNAEQRSRNQDQ